MDTGRALVELVARVLLAHMFLLSGIGKIAGYAETLAYMTHAGVWTWLLPLMIALELGGSVGLIVGWKTRWMAFALGLFTALTAVLFHSDFSDPVQKIQYMKNWTIVGGMLVLFVHGAGPFSIDAWRLRRRSQTGSS